MYKLSIQEDQHSSGNEDEDIYDDGLLVSSTFYCYICLFLSLSFLRFREKILGFFVSWIFVLFCFVLFLFLLKRSNVKFYIIMKQQTTTSILIIPYFQNRNPLLGEPWYFKNAKRQENWRFIITKSWQGKLSTTLESKPTILYLYFIFSGRGQEGIHVNNSSTLFIFFFSQFLYSTVTFYK